MKGFFWYNEVMKTPTLEQFRGCLLGGAVGDALGMPTEHGPARQEGQSIHDVLGIDRVTDYMDHPNPQLQKLVAGSYTDDTQQTICLAEHLLEQNGGFEAVSFARKIAETSLDDQRGIGPSTLKLIKALIKNRLETVMREGKLSNSPSNGSAMRIAPLALLYYWDLDRLRKMVIQSTEATHIHPTAKAGACAQAYCIAYQLRNPGQKPDPVSFRKELADYLEPVDLHLSTMIRHHELSQQLRCYVEDTVPEVIDRYLLDSDDFLSGVLDEVNSEGDTDTKASMLGSILGAKLGITSIPQNLLDGLENNGKGKDYLELLSQQLYELSERLRKESHASVSSDSKDSNIR
jgi:ADP-ribosylglycohydrolase